MATIYGQPITWANIRIPEQGDWFADVRTNSSERIPNGTRVDIVAGNLTLSGAIVRGNITESVGRYQVAGRPEWGTTIQPRAYRSAASVLRKTVFEDIARDTLGSSWASLVVAPPASNLGSHYERAGTFGDVEVLARDAIESLGLSWYVRNDGITVFGVRASGTVSTDKLILVSKRNDAIGYRVVNCDDISAFAPGLTFEGETIGDVTIAIYPKDIELHVWTRAASTSFMLAVRAAWRRMFPRVEMQGLFSYTTVGPSQSGKHDLRSTRSRHLPDIRVADAWTIAGHTAELVAGTRVLVAFADGDPAQPVIVAVDPSTLPTSSTHEAVASMDIDAAAIRLGSAEAAVLRSGDAVSVVTLPGPVVVAAGLIFRNADLATPVPTAIPTKVKA